MTVTRLALESLSASITTTSVLCAGMTRAFAPRVFGQNRHSRSKNYDTDHESVVAPYEPLGHSKPVLQMAPDDASAFSDARRDEGSRLKESVRRGVRKSTSVSG
jgi:hypothetical protein